MTARPALSVILVTPDGFDALRQTVRHLAAQTIRDRIEIVIVGPSRAAIAPDDAAVEGFARVELVEVGEVRSGAHGYTAGIRGASAPVVVLGEDHSFPDPDWGRALVRAHEGPWAAVGPVVANANPGSLISWADFLLGYGPWIEPAPAGEVEHLPGHNSAYKRDLLLEYGDDLESWMEAESVLHWDLRARGHRLYLEPAARTNHFNFSRLSAWLAASFHHGRTFAGRRARSWGRRAWLRRIAYTLASPLIPLVRLRRFVRDLRRSASPVSAWRLAPALLLELAVSAAGEAAGYAVGEGDSPIRVSAFEFHRERNMNPTDARAIREARFWS